MAGNYRTPGVYVEEIAKLPPSIAQVETAVPAFIGYTEKAEKEGKDLHTGPLDVSGEHVPTPIRIDSMLDYRIHFGGPPRPDSVRVELDANNEVKKVEVDQSWYLYDSLQMFFGNGGGKCYVVSVGHYDNAPDKADLLRGLKAIKKVDEPTLLLIPDAVLLSDADDLATVQQAMLAQAAELQDRFAILDIRHEKREVYDDGEVAGFRDKIGINDLDYGAAYFPWLRATLPVNYGLGDVEIIKDGSATDLLALTPDSAEVVKLYTALNDRELLGAMLDKRINRAISGTSALPYTINSFAASYQDEYDSLAGSGAALIKDRLGFILELALDILHLSGGGNIKLGNPALANSIAGIVAETGALGQLIDTLYAYDLGYNEQVLGIDPGGVTSAGAVNPAVAYNGGTLETLYSLSSVIFNDSVYKNADGTLPADAAAAAANSADAFQALLGGALAILQGLYDSAAALIAPLTEDVVKTNPVYARIRTAVGQHGNVLPPSGAIAGIYAYVDGSRGVWKAPANVSLSMVKGPTVNITHADQGELNVDAVAGKSVNAIRAFTGKGTLVWGARTLAGNDNEWRYVPVRRLFIMVEESVMKGTEPFVFEPNDRNTWMKVKAMIQNYLTGLWQQGALAGAKPEDAFYVSVGLGETMTAQDILEGRLIIEIGMAAVRPAEFIILRFSHKMQES